MKKVLVTLLIVLMAFSALFAQGKEEVAPTGKRTLRLSAESWQISKIFLEHAAQEFEAAHPDVDVEIITLADQTVLANYIIDWSKGNTETDLVFLDGGYLSKTYAAQDLIYDFEKDLKFFDDFPKSNFQPGALGTGVIEGAQVCLPAIYEVYGVSINTAMFKEAGLLDEKGNPLPMKTWDDFYNFAEKLTKKDTNGKVTQVGASVQFGNNLASIIGGTVIAQFGHCTTEDGYTYDIDNPEMRHIVDLWKKGVENGYFSTATFVDNAGGRNGFKAGQIAMCYEAAGRWMEALSTLGAESVSLVEIPGGQGTCCFGCQMAIPRASKNADLAVQFIKEALYGEYCQTNAFTTYGKMSVIKEYFEKALEQTPLWNNIADSMNKAVNIPEWEEQAKWLKGLNVIFQEGLVNPKLTGSDIVDQMVALSNSLKK
ncbi:MAG: extracellular solute-binding protein [Sphaerochaetaceae bacterium]|nr:extracellular solute-binding protein [Sphaerochaetaceae bacterium]MDD4841827.1 extracellular solute-binding protein [Sphaerochaetaceae bacterium]